MQNDLAQFEDAENRRQDEEGGGAVLAKDATMVRSVSRQSVGN
jgi:hypothetical protein